MQQDGHLVTKENTIDVSLDLSDHLGSLVFKEEQKLVVEALLSGKDVMAVLPNGFGKSIIYQSFKVFYSGPRGEVEIHYHFQRFWLLKEARINVQAWRFFVFPP